MASIHSQVEGRSGKLVALEGDIGTVATQLRLLPPSQKILVLPSLVERLPQDVEASPFNARAFVQDVHAVFTERTKTARDFLQSSTTAQPRLVLMNGGSITARTTCISRICENLTGGNLEEAESLLNDIVQDGITGLMKPEDLELGLSDTKDPNVPEDEEASEMDDIEEDPTTKAMKLADSLDRETAQLQAEHEDIEAVWRQQQAEENIRRSIYEEHLAEMPVIPTKPHIETPRHADDIIRTIITMPSRSQSINAKNDKLEPGFLLTAPLTANSKHSLAHRRQSADVTEDEDDEEQSDHDRISPGQQSCASVPHTPKAVYGEACIVDIQSPLRKNSDQWIRKVKSVDRFRPINNKIESLRSVFEPGSRPKSSGGRVETDYGRQEFPQLPRASFVRASQTTIKTKKLHTSRGSAHSISSFKPSIRVYVDRGTDAKEREESDESTAGEQNAEDVTEDIFEPVFPLVEDLIIQFTNHASNEVFDSVLQSYMNGTYPIIPHTSPGDEPAPSSTTSTDHPITQSQPQFGDESDDESDPYSFHNDYSLNNKQLSDPKKSSITDSAVHDLEPPTPSITPPPKHTNSIQNKFCHFSPINQNSAIGVQNSLRALLNLHFPAGEHGYTQHCFPVVPESDRLWKPVWRNEEHSNNGIEGRTVDMILAFGCEDGVKKNFFDSISGHLERLGTKRDGLSRTGRLDIRYLIANAMQTLSNIPINSQSDVNPLSNPSILAALLVPQLESYLAINTSVRFLVLTYPANYLPTVIALRRLVGQDLLKIAGILDSLSSDPPATVSRDRPRTPNSFHPLSDAATSSPPRNSRSHSNSVRTLHNQASFHTTKTSYSKVSFSKANYLLPSSATDAEITNFISGIWSSLIEKSDFYTPEPEPAPIIVEKIVERFIEKPALPPAPPTPTVSYRREPKEIRDSKISRLTGGDADQPSTRKIGHHYAASIASTVRTTATETVRKDRRDDEEWENFYIGEIDSDDDAFDRMIMGRSGARFVPEVVRQVSGKKRSSKKALKWLGLA